MKVRFTSGPSATLLTAISMALGGCASTPDAIPELQSAQALVGQVATSPRAGVAAENVSEARKSLDLAVKAADSGEVGDAKYHANVAATHAQIANEKILMTEARESLEQGTAERQKVVADARAREAEVAKQRAAGLEQELKDLKARKTDRGLVLTLGDVLFDTGKATLKPGAYATLERLATALKEAPDRKVVIEGHTDSVGSDEFNQQLSEQRALAVQAALMQRGVNGSQISAAGRGEGLPVASNDTPSGRQQNRRVELIFTEDQPRVATDTN